MSVPLVAAAAGVCTWSFMNRRSIRGDFFVIIFCLSAVLLYIFSSSFRYNHLVALIVYACTLSFSTLTYRLSPFHPLANFPGPILWKSSSITLAVVSFTGKRHLKIDELHKVYGKFVRIGPNALSVNSAAAGPVIYGFSTYMEKSYSYKKPGHVGGVSMFFKQAKKEHADRKKIWLNGFTAQAAQQYLGPLERETWGLMKCIERRSSSSKSVDMGECLNHWSYDFMGHMVFGGANDLDLMHQGDPHDLILGGKKATLFVDSIGQTPWLMDILWHIPGGGALHRLRNLSASMMRTRLKNQSRVDMKDLASYLIEGDDATGERIPVSDLEVESLVAIQAGSDNTGSVMTLLVYLLLGYPDFYRNLQASLDAAFPDPLAPLDNKKLNTLPLLDAAIHEALRLGTPFFLPRIVPDGGHVIEGQFVPGETMVALAAYSQQVDEANFYPAPLDFRPERWLPGGLGPDSIINKAATFSFSSGPYVCIAKCLAYQEMRHVIARILLTYDLSYSPDFDPKAFMDGFLNLRTTMFTVPLMVKAVRRHTFAFPEF